MLKDYLYTFIDKYNDSLSLYRQGLQFPTETQEAMRSARDIIKQYLANKDLDLRVKVSQAAPQWTLNPWLGIRNKVITSGFMKGVYVVYLLNKDTKSLYLTLNQGATEATYFGRDDVLPFTGISRVSDPKALERLKGNANRIRQTIYNNTDCNLSFTEIDCGSNSYNAGTIFSKEYKLSTLPNDEELFQDLDAFIEAYNYYKLLFIDDAEEDADSKLVNALAEEAFDELNDQFEYKREKKEKAVPTVINGRIAYQRDKGTAKNAIAHAHYCCEINPSHESFVRKSDNKRYTEPHHLIPLKYSNKFDYSLDVEENIVSLCSNCHNQIHYGKDADVLIKQLYEQRKDLLEQVGLKISLEELLNYYK